MSIETHSTRPPRARQYDGVSADPDLHPNKSSAETAITILVIVVTVAFVSFIAVVMTMA
jgi:hypothetical protein